MNNNFVNREPDMQYMNLSVNKLMSVIKVENDRLYYSDRQKVKILKGGNVAIVPRIIRGIESGSDSVINDIKNQNQIDDAVIANTIEFLVQKQFLIAGKSSSSETQSRRLRYGVFCDDAFRQLLSGQKTAQHNNDIINIDILNRLPADGKVAEQAKEEYKQYIADLKLDSVLLFPVSATSGQLCLMNAIFVELQIPYLLVTYDGRDLILGPSVLPMKTPCLDCLYEHRLKNLEKSGITRELFLNSGESFPLDGVTLHASQKQWLSWMLCRELLRLSGAAKPLLIKKQVRMPVHALRARQTTTFEPITSCPTCCGMNAGKVRTGRPDMSQGAKYTLNLSGNTSVQYRENGLRTASPEAARAILQSALDRLGVAVTIEKITSRQIDRIIPSFVSRVTSAYSPDLPIIDDRFHWGKGMTEEQAYLSGGFELLERISSEYYGDVEIIRCPHKAVRDIALDVPARVGTVYYSRNIDIFDENMDVDWVWGFSYKSRQPVLVPASMVFLTKAVFAGKFVMNTSSGLAAGATLQDAVLQGFMEAIEHDARYILQANAITMPRFANASFPARIREMIAGFNALNFEVIIRNYTLDSGIYVFRAWLVQKDNPMLYAGCGMGASLDPLAALNRALSEAKQSWPVFPRVQDAHYAAHVNSELYDANSCSLFNLQQDNQVDILPGGEIVEFSALENKSTGSVVGDIEKSCSLIAEHVPGFELVVVNLTKEIFGVPVVRVIASGLQNPYQPQQNFPGERLFNVPVALGLAEKKLNYREIFNDRHLQ